jgi:hypothetical protein
MMRYLISTLSILALTLPAGAFAAEVAVELGGQIRVRPELQANYGLDRDVDDDVLFVGQRARLDAKATLGENLSAFIQLQDVRTWGEVPTISRDGFTGIHQGWLEVGGAGLSLRAGRQKLVYGDQRLVGGLEWVHQARAFDAARLMWDSEHHDVHLWLSQTGITGVAARDQRGEGFHGLYTRHRLLDALHVDVYFLAREGRLDDIRLRILTPGVRLAGAVGDFAYTAEGAWQGGRRGAARHEAAAAAVTATYTFDVPMRPFVMAEVDWATGDPDPTDDVSREFDNLFPTNHMHYGYMDLVGWRNLRAAHGRVGFVPADGARVWLGYHHLSLDDPRGRWSNAGGATIVAADPDRDTDRFLGHQIDLRGTWQPLPALGLLGGYGLFLPGTFAREELGPNPAHFAYLQAELSF